MDSWIIFKCDIHLLKHFSVYQWHITAADVLLIEIMRVESSRKLKLHIVPAVKLLYWLNNVNKEKITIFLEYFVAIDWIIRYFKEAGNRNRQTKKLAVMFLKKTIISILGGALDFITTNVSVHIFKNTHNYNDSYLNDYKRHQKG